MIDSQFGLGELLLFRAVLEHSRHGAIDRWPDRQTREGLVVKAREQQGLLRKPSGDGARQSEQVWSRDDGIEFMFTSGQAFQERR